MINADHLSPNLEWIPESDRIQRFDGSISQREAISNVDAVVVVDTNSRNRLGSVAESLVNSPAQKFLIDHHPEPEKWFDLSYRRESASSTGELIYELIESVDPSTITEEIGKALYTAIMTDTNK